MGPRGLDYRVKHRYRHGSPRRAAAQSTAPSTGIVVAEPDCDRNVVGEADEPYIVLILGGARLAGDVGGEPCNGAGGSARQHALQHGLELIKGRWVDGFDRDRRCLVSKDILAIALDGLDRIGHRPRPLIGDRRIEGGKVNRPHGLRTKHERIDPLPFAIDLRLHRAIPDSLETGDRKSTRLNSSHQIISYAVFCLKKKK